MFARVFKWILAILLVASVVMTAAVWLTPVVVAQNWAFERAEATPFSQFEAVGQMEALWWLGRIALPCLIVGLGFGMARLHSLENGLLTLGKEFKAETAAVSGNGLGVWGLRLFLVVWMVLAVWHLASGVLQRTQDWPYYHWNSGNTVLPNISDSNRDVIRYLREATPDDARIFVFSDQKLFFLSYHLLPRRLFHRIHEDSEFVIPLPNQERQLAAYRPSDLDPQAVERTDPDYFLEYYEGSQYNAEKHRDDDANWVRFYQAIHQTTELPPFVVRLRPAGEAIIP